MDLSKLSNDELLEKLKFCDKKIAEYDTRQSSFKVAGNSL
jgi:hypothetical protein